MACLKRSLSLLVAAVLIFFPICTSVDIITSIQPLRDGETLVSAGKKFALGFFSPGNSKNRYVGIWYNNIPDPTIVWTANRENPVRNSSGVLTINSGNLVLVDGGHTNSSILWYTNVSIVPKSSSAALTDSGNLILRDDDQRILWQSFDYPTNTFLPGMIVRLDRAGLNRILTSWKSEDDPATGEFSFGFNPRDMPQLVLRKGSDLIWRSGPWNGQKFGGVPSLDRSSVPNVANDEEIYYPYISNDTSMISRSVLDDSGVFKRLMWSDKNRRWTQLWVALQDGCDRYGNCGAYGSCDPNRLAECTCMRGFEPKTPRVWNLRDWSDGCVRSRPLDCGGKGDGFLKLANVKVPDTATSRVELGLSLEACKEECLKTCSCTAYANANSSGKGSGCVIWYGNLIDIKVFGDSDEGEDLYTRVAASELRGFQYKRKLLVPIFIVIPVVLSFVLCGYCWWRKRKGCKMNERHETDFNENATEENGKGSELPIFSLGVIAAATNNFSESNMLGKGGFGIVYKGQLLNGQEIAVKRLCKNSGQGIQEFKTEVALIAKLQHKNLVRLLGCCMSRREKILIYEYMQNKSLDSHIFDQRRSVTLDWRKRFNIIIGIARGILYLHEDSRFRIIHRDLKVSNILLDDDMNPKISDFGMARIFGGNQIQANTNRVVGTYGYMSPEYAMNGLFSIKSDVFSFGVILLEIISGRTNNYYSDHHSTSLIGHVWELWKERKILDLIDPSISNSASESEVLRCIQVGLLCVQQKAKDRPTMSSVVFMLSNETTMASPNQPAFCFLKESFSDNPFCSVNEVTITKMKPR